MSRGNRTQSVRVGDEPNVTDGAMTFQEIADEMGISKQLVWFHYRSAIRKLRRKAAIYRIRDIARGKTQ
jgi:predicted DNA-binding protein (UPF0251 family)